MLDELELRQQALPCTVAVNHFPGTVRHTHQQLGAALDLAPGTPIVDCDARDRASSAAALITTVEHSLAAWEAAQ